jgi:hypothetical protein
VIGWACLFLHLGLRVHRESGPVLQEGDLSCLTLPNPTHPTGRLTL